MEKIKNINLKKKIFEGEFLNGERKEGKEYFPNGKLQF